MRWKRIIYITFAFLLVLIAAAYLIIETVDFNRFKPTIERVVKQATGRDLVIAGDIDFAPGLAPGFAFSDIRMQNAPWGLRPDWLEVKEIKVRISPLPLLFGRLTLKRITILQPDILIETAADGKINLAFDTQAKDGDRSEAPSPPALSIDEILIKNGRVSYRDARAQRSLELELRRLDAGARGKHFPVDLDVSGAFERHRFQVRGQMANPIAVWQKDRPLTLDLTLNALDCDLRLRGKLEDLSNHAKIDVTLEGRGSGIRDILDIAGLPELPDPGAFRLTGEVRGSIDAPGLDNMAFHIGHPQLVEIELTGAVADLTALKSLELSIAAQGQDFSRLEKFLGRTPALTGAFELSGRVTDTPDQCYRFDDIRLTIGDNHIEANADIDVSGTRPRVTVDAQSRHFDLQPLFQTAGALPAADTQTGGDPPKTPKGNAIEWLGLADVNLNLRSGKIELPRLTLRDLTVSAVLDDGRVDFEVDAPALPDLEALTGLTRMSEMGPFRIAGTLSEGRRGLTLANLDFKTGRTASVEVAATGAIGSLLEGPSFGLDFRLQGDDAAILANYIVEPWPLHGPFRVTGRMSTDGIELFRFGNLRGTLGDIDFKGNVKVDASGEVPIVLTAVSAPRFNLGPLSLPGLSLPEGIGKISDLGPLKAEIKIAVPDGPVGFDAVRVQAGTPDLIQASLTGRVADVENLQGADLHFTALGNEVNKLEKLSGQAIPVHGPFELATDVKYPTSGRVHLENVEMTLGPNRFRADASIDTRRRRPKLTAAIDGTEFDVAAIVPKDEKRSLLKGHFSDGILKERLILPRWPAPTWLIKNDAEIQVNLDRLSISRLAVDDLTGRFELQSGRIVLTVEGLSYAEVEDVSDISGRLAIGPTDLQVRGTADPDRLALQAVRLQAGDAKTGELHLEGNVTDVARQQGLDVRFNLSGDNSEILNAFLAPEKPLEGPFRFSGHLVDPKLKEYRLEDVQLLLGDSDLSGWVDIDLSPRRPRIEAKFSSRRLDLRPFTGYADLSAVDADEGKPPPKKSPPTPSGAQPRKVFSDEPLPLGGLDRIDLQLSFECNRFYSTAAAVDDLLVTLALENGDLRLQPFRFNMGQGPVNGHLTLQTRNDVKTAAVFLEVENYDIGQELSRLGLERELEGTVDARIDVAGPAGSVADFMGQLNGRLTLSLEDGRVQEKYIGLLYADLASTLTKLINPFGTKDKYIDLNCFINTFQIESGTANYASVLDSDQATLYGGGTLALKTERLDITLKSSPKGGFRIRGLGRIGFSLSELTRPFKLGGTLARPSLQVDPAGTVWTFGKILGGLALGPYGIAVVFADVSVGADNPCAKALLEAQKDLKTD